MHLTDLQQREMDDNDKYFPGFTADFDFMTLAMAGEVGEICNDVKKHLRGDYDIKELQKRMMDELPDVLIYLVMLADTMGFSLEMAYDLKKRYNDERFGPGSSTTPE